MSVDIEQTQQYSKSASWKSLYVDNPESNTISLVSGSFFKLQKFVTVWPGLVWSAVLFKVRDSPFCGYDVFSESLVLSAECE